MSVIFGGIMQINNIKLKCLIIINIILLILFYINIAFSQPSISSVSGDLVHGGTLIINGSNFGVKSPAAPLMWDNCETAVVNNEAEVLNRGWLDPWPRFGTSSIEHRIKYRNAPYHSTAPPHQYSTKYLVGGHYQTPNNVPPYIGPGGEDYRNVMVTAYAGGPARRWFAIWYVRHDSLWYTPCDQATNEKWDCINGGPSAYYGSSFLYTGTNAYESTCNNGPNRWNYFGGFYQYCQLEDVNQTHNARFDWVKMEHRVANDNLGFHDVLIDNIYALRFTENCPYFWDNLGGEYLSNGIQSFTIGGYYRHGTNVNDITTYRGDVNNFRYFDDMYIDTTLARVILGNAADYSACTILEPQIPTSWSNNSVTCTINLGRLSNQNRVYVFVFNRDDVRNLNGYPIGEEPPSKPRGIIIGP